MTKNPIGRPRQPEGNRVVRLETTIRRDQLDWLNREASRLNISRADIIRAMIDVTMSK